MVPAALAASIPSPHTGVWWIGPLPIRAYALLILTGMVVAVLWTRRRYAARGGDPELVLDVTLWAIPAGIIGARLYHVVSSPDAYFGPGGNPWQAFEIWKGGLGIWGGVAAGAAAAAIVLHRRGVRLGPFADAIAPALLVAQAIGRLGNWANQELFGGPTTLPWGLEIDAAHMPAGFVEGTLFHPTFLYELVWNLAMAALLVVWDRWRRPAAGQLFASYLMAYTAGRAWIEMMRIDEAEHLLGLRLNVFTSVAIFLVGLVLYVALGRLARPREAGPVGEGTEAAEAASGPGIGSGEAAQGSAASGNPPTGPSGAGQAR